MILLPDAHAQRLFREVGVTCYFLLLLMVTVPAFPARPSQDELRTAEQIAKMFADGKMAQVETYFSAPLAKHIPPENLLLLRRNMEKQHGEVRHVQAAYPLQTETETSAEGAVVPIDFEKFAAEMVLTWEGELIPEALSGFTLGPQQLRPTPQAAPPKLNLRMEYKPPSYAKPETFDEWEVLLGPKGYELTARLSVPRNATRRFTVPGVILIPGRGVHDSDGSTGPNKIFRDITHGLSSRGIAVLRFAPRADAVPDTLPAGYGIEEALLYDTREAIRFMASRPGIDREKIFLAGWGLGGTLAPHVAVQVPQLRGLIILAAPPAYDTDFVLRKLNAEADLSDPAQRQWLNLLERNALALKAKQLRPFDTFHDAPVQYWYSLENIDPIASLGDWPGPVLYLAGEKDYVLTQGDIARWQTVLSAQKNRKLLLLPGLNRYLMTSPGKGHPSELLIPGHVSREVVERIAAFVHR